MSIKFSASHNIEDVISDIDDVKDDLRSEMLSRVGAVVRELESLIANYILADPDASGNMLNALSRERDSTRGSIDWKVFFDGEVAPYVAVVEYGSGRRREVAGPDAKPFPSFGDGERRPPDYPFDAPDINNISGFAYYIEEWMKDKGLSPKYGDYRASALAIAQKIDEMGTYAHPTVRPAWFKKENDIRDAAKTALRKATN